MAYRNLTQEQFNLVKEATKKVCKANGLKTIGDFKRIGNEIINEIEKNRLNYGDLLQPEISYTPKPNLYPSIQRSRFHYPNIPVLMFKIAS